MKASFFVVFGSEQCEQNRSLSAESSTLVIKGCTNVPMKNNGAVSPNSISQNIFRFQYLRSLRTLVRVQLRPDSKARNLAKWKRRCEPGANTLSFIRSATR